MFKDPLYISNQANISDWLVITIKPAALKYFKTIATGATTEKPLRTEIRMVPPQAKLGELLTYAIKVAIVVASTT